MPFTTTRSEVSDDAHAPALSPIASSRPIPYEGILVAILLLAAILCYANMLTNSFVYDDDQQILENPYVKSWHYLPQIFGTTVWSFVGQAGTTNYYRPLMTFSFLVLWTLFGAVPFGFHLLSLVLHAAVVLLGFYAGQRLFNDWRIAWVAALLFAVHPAHTEAVDWISAYPDLQVAVFFLAAFLWYARPCKPTWTHQALLLAFFALALLSKEPGLMFIPVAMVYEHLLRRDQTPVRKKVFRYLPLICVGAIYMGLRVALFGKLAPVLQHPQITWPQTIYSAFAMICDYTVLLVWPSHMSAFHDFQASTSLFETRVLIGLSLLVAAITATIRLRHTAPAVSLSLVWLGVTLAPVLNARWMAANVLTERYLYLPSWGFFWIVAWIAVKCTNYILARQTDGQRSHTILNGIEATILVVVVALAALATYQRNRIWQDDVTLYTQTLKTDPHSYPILLNLGLWYHQRDDFRNAETQYLLALRERPDAVNVLNALGVLYFQQNRFDDAAAMLNRAIAVKKIWAPPHYNLGRLLQKQGRNEQALRELQTGVRLAPLDPQAHRFYGDALAEFGSLAEARAEYQRSIELSPSLEAERGLASVLIRAGDAPAAQTALHRLVAEYPYDGAAHLELARFLDQGNQPEEALQQYRQVLETDPANAEAKAAVERLTKARLKS